MTTECGFCKGTGIEPGFTDCVWCENSGRAEGITPEGIKRACAEIKAVRDSLERTPAGDSEMDGVKRYGFKYDGMFEMEAPGGWVKASDYDAALAREAALREELAASSECYRSLVMRSDVAATVLNEQEAELKDVHQRLTAAAEQRNAEFEGWVRKYRHVLLARKYADNDEGDMWRRADKIELDALNAVLTKPTESGARDEQ